MKKPMFSFFLRLKKKVYIIVFLIIIMFVAIKKFYKPISNQENEVLEDIISAQLLTEKELDSRIAIDESINLKKPEVIVTTTQENLQKEPKAVSTIIKPVVKKLGDVNITSELVKNNAVDTILELHKGLEKISLQNFNNYKEIIKLINSTYDTEKMTAMIIGNVWKNISIKKKKEMLVVFEEYIAKNYIKRFTKIKKLDFENGENKKVGNNYMMVKTKLIFNDNEKVSIDYLLTFKGGKWKIFDVLLAGSVSEIATKKSEFSGFIKNDNIDSLIFALKKKNIKLMIKEVK